MSSRVVLVFACLPFLVVGCSGDGNTVEMVSGRSFDPVEITVPVGTTVEWVSRDDEAHSVTAYEDSLPEGADYFASGGFSSEDAARENIADGLLEEGDSFEVTFEVPGTYEYFCIPHESAGMTGTVVVEA